MYSFTGPNGYYPDATLAVGADGRLYGTTESGGRPRERRRSHFRRLSCRKHLAHSLQQLTESLLYKFTASDVQSRWEPRARRLRNIYEAPYGCNTLPLQFTNRGIQVLHSFPAFQGDGVGPIGVVKGANGLYGITQSGSDLNAIGTVYTTAGGYHALLEFIGGIGELDSLAVDQADNLYYTFSSIGYVCKEEYWLRGRSTSMSSSGGGSTSDRLRNALLAADVLGVNRRCGKCLRHSR